MRALSARADRPTPPTDGPTTDNRPTTDRRPHAPTRRCSRATVRPSVSFPGRALSFSLAPHTSGRRAATPVLGRLSVLTMLRSTCLHPSRTTLPANRSRSRQSLGGRGAGVPAKRAALVCDLRLRRAAAAPSRGRAAASTVYSSSACVLSSAEGCVLSAWRCSRLTLRLKQERHSFASHRWPRRSSRVCLGTLCGALICCRTLALLKLSLDRRLLPLLSCLTSAARSLPLLPSR